MPCNCRTTGKCSCNAECEQAGRCVCNSSCACITNKGGACNICSCLPPLGKCFSICPFGNSYICVPSGYSVPVTFALVYLYIQRPSDNYSL
ncbi:unnamed protein product [Rotaria sordida]|uniref:Metallothionein n=1 Tax=Rotaria sordida TaxID=392033 RepID=A0A815MNS0_9BILA|nr:unnamed protein product [Rotaria sordida]